MALQKTLRTLSLTELVTDVLQAGRYCQVNPSKEEDWFKTDFIGLQIIWFVYKLFSVIDRRSQNAVDQSASHHISKVAGKLYFTNYCSENVDI